MTLQLQSSIVRNITQNLPLPGKYVRSILNEYDATITYPSAPVVVPVKGGFGLFEIKNFCEYIQRNIYFLGYYELRETRLFEARNVYLPLKYAII